MKTLYVLSYRFMNGDKVYKRGGLNTKKPEDAMKWKSQDDAERYADQQGLNMWKVEPFVDKEKAPPYVG